MGPYDIDWQADCDKMGVAYPRVPLTRRANRALAWHLRRRARLRIAGPWLFPSAATRDGHLALSKDNAASRLREAEVAAGVAPLPGNTNRWHGFRYKWVTEPGVSKQTASVGGWQKEGRKAGDLREAPPGRRALRRRRGPGPEPRLTP